MAIPQDNSWLYPSLGYWKFTQACTSKQVTMASQQLAQPETD